MIKVEVRVPQFTVETNEDETLAAMAQAVAGDVRARLAAGQGSRGALPSPKDGGEPLNRTGELAASIRGTRSRQRNEWIVRAVGSRGTAEERSELRRKAAERQESRRNAKLEAFLGANPSTSFTAQSRKLRTMLGISKIRSRAVTTNAGLLAVLAAPPKDVRARNGDRGRYAVLEPTERYSRIAKETGQRVLRTRVVQRWQTVVKV